MTEQAHKYFKEYEEDASTEETDKELNKVNKERSETTASLPTEHLSRPRRTIIRGKMSRD